MAGRTVVTMVVWRECWMAVSMAVSMAVLKVPRRVERLAEMKVASMVELWGLSVCCRDGKWVSSDCNVLLRSCCSTILANRC